MAPPLEPVFSSHFWGLSTFTLTTAADNITGTSGNDTIVGTLPYLSSGAGLDASATLTSGDQINGGSGNDTLAITISGSDVSTTPVTPSMSGVENISVANYETEAAQDVTIDLSLAGTALAQVGTVASTTTSSSTIFQSIGQSVGYVMAGKGNLTASYASGILSGGADSANVTLNAVGDSSTSPTLSIASIEILNITSATASNYVKVADQAITGITASGDKALAVQVLDTGVTSFDASTATGTINADLSAITFTNLTSVKGGTGTADKLTIGASVTVNSSSNGLSKVSGFEALAIKSSNSITMAADTSGITSFDLKTASTSETLNLNTGYTG